MTEQHIAFMRTRLFRCTTKTTSSFTNPVERCEASKNNRHFPVKPYKNRIKVHLFTC